MIEGVHFVRSARAGKPIRWYVYAYRGGPCILKSEGPKKPKLSPDSLEALRAAQTQSPQNTIAGLIWRWTIENGGSAEWKKMAPSTRRNWSGVLNLIEAKWGATPLSIWSDPRMVVKVMNWRDSVAEMPRTADYRITVLCSLLEWGRLRGLVKVNVARGIPKLYEGGNREEIIWTLEDRKRFASVANECVTDALELACLTGLRLADLAALTWDEVGEHAIVRLAFKKSKGKRRRARVPMYMELRQLLTKLKTRSRAPNVNTVLVTSAGQSWSSNGLGKRVAEARDRAGIVHVDENGVRKKHLHDCRGSFATALIGAGLSDEEVGDTLAWAPERVENIRSIYVADSAVVVALAHRIDAASVKQRVKQKGVAA